MSAHTSKQVYSIRDLTTKSVVLYPTRAHVTREINNVVLKPGANEVEIFGLSPTVDEHSIQIEGQGPASIADMTVQLIPNRDIFDEVYPDDSDASDDESDTEYRDSDDEEDEVRRIEEELKELRLQVTEATETQNSANERLATLDRYAKSASAEQLKPDEVSKLLKEYEEGRTGIFKVHTDAAQKLTTLNKMINRKEEEKLKAGKEAKKQKEKLEKQKAKQRRHKALKKAEKAKETKHIKDERLRYWAKKVYKITLLLESSVETPGSSRRNSLDSITLASSSQQQPLPKIDKSIDTGSSQTAVSLLLSYVTKEAGWSPRYDLRISSVQKTAAIVYRTEFLNRTSEIWKDAKLSFSTSQTSYQGLDDTVPFMNAWRIKLGRYNSGDGGLLSPEETEKTRAGRPGADTFNRADLFGLDDNFVPVWQSKRPLQVQKASNAGGNLFGSSISTASSAVGKSMKFSSAPSASFGGHESLRSSSHPQTQVEHSINAQQVALNSSHSPQLSTAVVSARRSARPVSSMARVAGAGATSLFRGGRKKDSKGTDDSHSTVYEDIVGEEDEEDFEESIPGTVDFEDAAWEDNGLTATYEVPGVRTLEPSSLTRRHKIASLHASNIHLSHICVPKLRSAAFLRAKIRNPSSSVTLLKGSAGVTLDGSFLGNMDLPRVSPGQIFDIPLGVDPAIHVNYPKPSVHRSTQGIIFNKESAQVFTRSIWLNNTRPQSAELLVLDQVPVSEDERLRIAILTPRGLAKEGDNVKAGVSAKEGSSGAVMEKEKDGKSESWGNAVAKLKKNGEVGWTVKLEGGKGCLLKVEYEARLPPSEKIVPA